MNNIGIAMQRMAALRSESRSPGFTLIDSILTLTLLAVASGVILAFFTGTTALDQPAQRLQADKELQFATESILADYYNNYWRSWDEAPPDGFDVCDESKPKYNPRYNSTAVDEGGGLQSSLMLFKEQVEANASTYGNVTIVDIECMEAQDTDDLDLQQLVINLQSNNPDNPRVITITVGK